MNESFSDHIAGLQNRYQKLFEKSVEQGLPLDQLLIHSGSEKFYFADDQTIPFRAYGHFNHWLPVNRPDQLLLISASKRPTYFQLVPTDYWHDQSIENAEWWCNEFEIVSFSDSNELMRELKSRLGNLRNLAFIGENIKLAAEIGIPPGRINPQRLISSLDYYRAYKSSYEIEQIKAANRLALLGHTAARDCFNGGGSELEIHQRFMMACNMVEYDSPYTNIVAINESAAVLHYQNKRSQSAINSKSANQVLLIDAGCRVNNYCSDITRTSVSESCHPVFKSLTCAMEALQLSLIDQARPGVEYIDFHLSALRSLGQTLMDHDIVFSTVNKTLDLSIPALFMPHGVGHLLGIQVHDVGGHLANSSAADKRLPPEQFPYLRNTRTMEDAMVFTVEPGVYFIPLLLDKWRGTPNGKKLNWQLIDELIPLGGIRIEDNVLVTNSTVENLTRQ